MRKEKVYTVSDKGRDYGKSFLLTEMAADRAEKWAIRALSAAARAGVDVGSLPSGGMAGIAVVGVESLLKVSFEEAEPLIDELFTCVKIIRDPKHPEMTFALIENDIEEIATRFQIRMEVMKLHLDFLDGVGTSKSTSETTPNAADSSNTPTSRPSSAPPSRLKRQR